MDRVTQFEVFVTEPPIVEISGGIVKLRDRSGAVSITRAMSIRTLEKTLERARRALDRIEGGDETVLIAD